MWVAMRRRRSRNHDIYRGRAPRGVHVMGHGTHLLTILLFLLSLGGCWVGWRMAKESSLPLNGSLKCISQHCTQLRDFPLILVLPHPCLLHSHSPPPSTAFHRPIRTIYKHSTQLQLNEEYIVEEINWPNDC